VSSGGKTYRIEAVRQVWIPKAGGNKLPTARDSDAVGIEHLMQLALGMMDRDGPNWRPILGDVDPIRYRS
jgi:hypothetical protein